MQNIHHALRSILITLLLPSITVGVASSEKPAVTEQTFQAIRDCMSRSSAPWSNEWKKEYIDTIRKAILSHEDTQQYIVKLEILGKGFVPYWEALKKNEDRPSFEVHLAHIRWYTEYLMGTEFPTEKERQKLRDQYKDLWDHAASSLLVQFPFLDPNAVQAAKADHLSQCYRKIEAPLLPVYLRPLSEAQVGQIKQRWDKLRYARVDLWRRLGGNSTTPAENNDAPLSNAEHDYQLTQRTLEQLLAYIWSIAVERPDYYRSAVENRSNAVKRRLQSMREARSEQEHLERDRSRQFLQTEHISFLLAALLETTWQLDRSASVRTQEQIPLEQQDKTVKGGGAYELKNGSQEK